MHCNTEEAIKCHGLQETSHHRHIKQCTIKTFSKCFRDLVVTELTFAISAILKFAFSVLFCQLKNSDCTSCTCTSLLRVAKINVLVKSKHLSIALSFRKFISKNLTLELTKLMTRRPYLERV